MNELRQAMRVNKGRATTPNCSDFCDNLSIAVNSESYSSAWQEEGALQLQRDASPEAFFTTASTPEASHKNRRC